MKRILSLREGVVLLGAFAELGKTTYKLRLVRPSVRVHGTTLLQLGGFSCNMTYEYF